MTKRILIFSTAYFPFVGGAEMAVKEITNRLDDYQFDLITARLDRRLAKHEKIGKVDVYRVGFGFKLDKFLLPLLGLGRALYLDKTKFYKIIFSLMASQASIAAAFFKILKPGKKLLLNLQEGDEEEHLKRYVFDSDLLYNLLIRPWHLLIFKKADLVIAISGYLKSRALTNGVSCPVEILPNGVDVKKFKVESLKLKVKELKSDLNIKSSEKVIITASRLVKKNAVDDIIKALKYLSENIKFLILGDGPDRIKLASLAERLNLLNRIIFFGVYNNDDLPQYLALADVFVRPSLSEGQGIAFLEAMAAGVPVIATPVGGIIDFLQDGRTGLFCQVHNPKNIAEKVKILLDNKELAETIKINARELVVKNYDWNPLAGKMNNIFKKLLAGK